MSGMDAVRIGAADEYLLLSPDDESGSVRRVRAELASPGLHAVRTVVDSYTSGFADLAELFQQLERDWRGWTGIRRWQALDGGLSLEARYEYHCVHVRANLWNQGPGWGNSGWTVTADVTIDPGEQLSQIAADLRQFSCE